MSKVILAAIPVLILAGCSTAPAAKPNPPRSASSIQINPPTAVNAKGLEAVLGKNEATLRSMFGEPRLNVQEVVGRKLQFSGPACVLDAFLYPDENGKGEVVTHVDARRSDGAEVDRAACVNALRRQ